MDEKDNVFSDFPGVRSSNFASAHARQDVGWYVSAMYYEPIIKQRKRGNRRREEV